MTKYIAKKQKKEYDSLESFTEAGCNKMIFPNEHVFKEPFE